jgi:hypothetical protein
LAERWPGQFFWRRPFLAFGALRDLKTERRTRVEKPDSAAETLITTCDNSQTRYYHLRSKW